MEDNNFVVDISKLKPVASKKVSMVKALDEYDSLFQPISKSMLPNDMVAERHFSGTVDDKMTFLFATKQGLLAVVHAGKAPDMYFAKWKHVFELFKKEYKRDDS